MRPDGGARGRGRWPTRFRLSWPFGPRRLSPAAPGPWLIVALLPHVSVALTIVALVGALITAALPLGFTLTTGALVGAVPGAIGGGFAAPAGQRALRSLAILAALFVAQRTLGPVRGTLLFALGRDLDRYLDERLMRALQAPPGIAHLEDPAVLDQIRVAQGIGENGYTPGDAAIALGNKLPIWLQSGAYAVVLARFQPWLALGYFAVQVVVASLNRQEYLRTIQVVAEQTHTLRRSDYLRDLALTAGAAKEVRLFALADWLIGRYSSTWLASITAVWRDRRQGDARLRVAAVVAALTQVVVLGTLGRAGVDGSISLTALTVFVGSVFGIQSIASLGQDDFALAWGTASVPAILAVESLTEEHTNGNVWRWPGRSSPPTPALACSSSTSQRRTWTCGRRPTSMAAFWRSPPG